MNTYVLLLIAAGAGLVLQNILMARITDLTSTILFALVLNSAVGLVLLSTLLLRKVGLGGLAEVLHVLKPWALVPGILGSFFVFASITGYAQLGAAATISILVASQLIFGLGWDILKAERFDLHQIGSAAFGALLLLSGAYLIITRSP
jgi:transporter family-2 protein